MKIYRKRYIPEELLWLKDDEIISVCNENIFTKWNSLKPRDDFARGISCYFLLKNYKISKILDKNYNLVYYYCDIVKPQVNKDDFIFCDLLVDVIFYPDDSTKILDLDELIAAYKSKLISEDDLLTALTVLDEILTKIYTGEFKKIIRRLDVFN